MKQELLMEMTQLYWGTYGHLDTNDSIHLKLPINDVVIIPNRGNCSYHQGHLRPGLIDLLAQLFFLTLS